MSIPIPLFRCRFPFSPRHANKSHGYRTEARNCWNPTVPPTPKDWPGKKKKKKREKIQKRNARTCRTCHSRNINRASFSKKRKKNGARKKKRKEKKSGNTPKRILHANPSTDVHRPIRQDVNNSNKKKKTGWRPFASCSIYRTFQAPSLTARRGTWRWLPYLRIVLTTRYYFCFLFLRFTKNEKVCGPDLWKTKRCIRRKYQSEKKYHVMRHFSFLVWRKSSCKWRCISTEGTDVCGNVFGRRES